MKALQPGDEVTVQRRGSRDDWRGEVIRFAGSGDAIWVLVRLSSGAPLAFWCDSGASVTGRDWYLAAKHVPARAA